ncbi:MAG: cyclic nucleotide-binding protein [Rhodocyclaceae bacterium]|jgi:CRP-like cAMP-binding protein|nr:MAG: cyclic nucleotide-binding protein [Rhodocyclaceae bacterium]TND00599.1 MAG: cyclic nucleotide-binding protein [Rhodocyclaceae bacterium]
MQLFYSLFRDDPRMLAVRAGVELFSQDDPADLMYVLTTGEARIRVGQREVERLLPGAIVGEMALIDQQPRSATVEAVTDCEFVCVDEKRFKFLVTETPGFALGVMKVLADRLRSADHMIG